MQYNESKETSRGAADTIGKRKGFQQNFDLFLDTAEAEIHSKKNS